MFSLLTAAAGLLGFALQPKATGPPVLTAESRAPAWGFTTTPAPIGGAMASEEIYGCAEAACSFPLSGYTFAGLNLSATYSKRVRAVDIRLALTGNDGPCPKPAYSGQPSPGHGGQEVNGICVYNRRVQLSPASPHLNQNIQFLIPNGQIFSHTGAYTSVEVPGVQLSQVALGALQLQFVIEGQIAAPQLSMLSGPGPKYVTPNFYTWIFSQTSAPALVFTITDLSGVENDSRKTFLSGIALGIAGAAFIGLAEELVRPLSRRKKSHAKQDQAPEPADDHQADEGTQPSTE